MVSSYPINKTESEIFQWPQMETPSYCKRNLTPNFHYCMHVRDVPSEIFVNQELSFPSIHTRLVSWTDLKIFFSPKKLVSYFF